MASLSSLTASPNPVPSGQNQTTLSVTFNLDAGSADRVGAVQLRDPSGAVVGNLSVTFTGTPPETEPVVQIGATPGQWSLVVDQGSLAALGSNDFRWTV